MLLLSHSPLLLLLLLLLPDDVGHVGGVPVPPASHHALQLRPERGRQQSGHLSVAHARLTVASRSSKR